MTHTHTPNFNERKYFRTFLVIKLHIHHLSVCVSVCLCLSVLYCSLWKLYPPYLCGWGKGVLRTHVECILATRQCKSPPSLSEAEDESEEEQVYLFIYFLQFVFLFGENKVLNKCCQRPAPHSRFCGYCNLSLGLQYYKAVFWGFIVIKLLLAESIAMITNVSEVKHVKSCVWYSAHWPISAL